MTTPLAIYIHWPYCDRICPYCDFNVYKTKGADGDLLKAIVKDLEYWRAETGPRYVTSIHFGGGTPSLLSGHEVSTLIETASNLWGLNDETEIASEANPSNADAQKWANYYQAGVNRLSLGVQTFNNDALKFLGRDHHADQAKAALQSAVSIFPSVSADLIFGWAGQTKTDLQADLDTLLSFGTHHISTYQLTVEDGTAFAKAEARGLERAVNEETSADLFDLVIPALRRAGFDHYEVSNFAKQGHQSKHNLAYWRGSDYVGVGPGAHGRLTKDGVKYATVCAMRPKDYRKCVTETGTGIEHIEGLTPESHAEEYVLMGLRINEGISLNRYKEIRGYPLDAAEYAPLIDDGFLEQKADRLIATSKGRFVLNAVSEALLT